MQIPAKSSLSLARTGLVEWMQRIDFGTIEYLVIREGEPVLDPRPRVIRDVKFGGENGPRPERALDDFVLKAQVLDLFAQLDSLSNGTISRLEVKHGLPFRMQVEEVAA